VAAVALASTLASCGGGGGESAAEDDPRVVDADGDDRPGLVVDGLAGQRAEMVTSPWLANLDLFRLASETPGTGDLNLSLLRYSDGFAVSNHVDFFAPALDECVVRRDVSQNGEGDEGDDSSGPPPRISGGTVTLQSGGLPWATFEPTSDLADGPDYFTDNGLPGALPDDLTLSVAGDAFPALSGLPLREPAVPVRVLPVVGERPTGDAVYSWMPDGGSDYIEIDFIAFDALTGDFKDFPAGCSVVDDGSFALPDDVRAFLDSTPDTLEVRYNRAQRRIDLYDGVVVFTRIVVGE